MTYRSRREWLHIVGTAGIIGIAGCSSSEEPATEADTSTTTEIATEVGPASLVEQYYTAAAGGELEEAAGCLSLTQREDAQVSAEEMAEIMQDDRGMSPDGNNGSIGEFNDLSMSEFAMFTFFDEDGEQQDLTEQELAELVPNASAFGGDEEEITLVHHTGGFIPNIWVPSQPTEAPADGYGEVIIYVGPFEGDPYIIGDFRSFVDLKAIEG